MILLTALASCLAGCGSSSPAELPNAGKSTLFVPGILGFDMECVPILDGATTAVDISYGIPPPSLTFFKAPSGFQAIYEISVRARTEGNKELQSETSWQETTFVSTYTQTQRMDPIEHVRRVKVPPGRTTIQMRLEQTPESSSAVRTQTVDIPSPLATVPVAAKMYVQWRQPDGQIGPFVFFHIPSGLDSLRVAAKFFHLPLGGTITLHFAFEHFRYDTAVPRAPYLYASAIPFQHQFSTEDRGAFDTVLTAVANVIPTSAQTVGVMPLPTAESGLYRVSVRAVVPDGGDNGADTVISLRRVISIKGVTFPRPSTLDELVGPLRYIATEAEMDRILSAGNETEKRARFDVFWLSHAADRAAAAGLIKEYYTRVTDANRYFSSVKEGWRTDMGMVYIVLGPPASVSRVLGGEVWQYTFPGSAGATSFRFTAITITGDGVSLSDDVLSRDAIYEEQWTRMVSHWRRGETY